MTYPTDEELDALVIQAQAAIDRVKPAGILSDNAKLSAALFALYGLLPAITALRTQLAELRAGLDQRVDMHECAMAERDDATLYSEEQKARAERAEAALAAQIEADGWQSIETAPRDGTPFLAFGGGLDHVDLCRYNETVGCWNCSEHTLDDTDHEPDGYNRPTHWIPVIAPTAQPHDRTALDRMLAEANEKALREAAAVATDWQNETGTDIAAAARICPQIADAILALIEAPDATP